MECMVVSYAESITFFKFFPIVSPDPELWIRGAKGDHLTAIRVTDPTTLKEKGYR